MSRVDEMKTLILDIKNVMMKNDAFPVCNVNSELSLTDPQQCEVLNNVIQQLMNQGVLVVERLPTNENVSTREIPYDEVSPLLPPI